METTCPTPYEPSERVGDAELPTRGSLGKSSSPYRAHTKRMMFKYLRPLTERDDGADR